MEKYIDDVLILGRSEEALAVFEKVLDKCVKFNVELKLAKCYKMLHREIKYLGFLVNHKGVRPDPK